MSPSLISSAASAKSDFRSPPSTSEPYLPGPRHYSSPNITRHQHSQRSGSESVFSNWDESPIKSDHASGTRVTKRGSEDQSSFSEPDSAGDFAMEEPGVSSTTTTALRQLHLDDQPPASSHDQSISAHHHHSPFSPSESRTSGMKRGASSPPPEASRGDKVPLHSGGPTTTTTNNRQSPFNPYPQPHGSFSPSSSMAYRNGSYASSTGLSAGASSTTSIPSQDRLSPRGLSPTSEYQQNIQNTQYTHQQPMNPSPHESFPHSHQRTPSDSRSAAAIARKMSNDSTQQRKGSAPSLQAHVHMCSCCPKKPKKFDTLEELR